MSKPIEIVLLPEAEKFVDTIETSARKKLFYAIRKTKIRVKKTNKTPKQDIKKAEMIKDKYFKGLI